MSSHHIIREDQEPALVIANGQACKRELLDQLLEWSPKVIVLDGAIERALQLGIKIDALLGDFDRLDDIDSLVEAQQPIEVVHTPDQNKTDLEKAFDYLIEQGHRAVNVIWATGRRADHSLANITNIVKYRHQLKIVLFDDYSKIFALPNHYEKWYPKGTPLSLIPVGTVEGIYSAGLSYNLHNETLQLGYRNGNSNAAAEDGFVTISYQAGDLLMMECWDLPEND